MGKLLGLVLLCMMSTSRDVKVGSARRRSWLACKLNMYMLNKLVKYHYCDTCSYKSKTSQGLTSHKERNHIADTDRQEEFSCARCLFKTNKKWCLQYHMSSKHTKRYACSKCPFSTPLEETLKAHKCKLYECSQCNYKTYRRNYIKTHFTKHRNPEELPPLKCPFCPFTTTSPSSFASHKNNHKHNKDMKCPECQLVLKKKSLINHMKTKHSKEKNAYHACPSCDYSTANTSNLQRHIESKHTDKSEWEALKCDKCDFKTKSKGSLYLHEKNVHSNTAMYKCEKCDLTTSGRSNFLSHIKIHGNREIVVCSKCTKTFVNKASLRAHFRRMHEQRRGYVCDLCPTDFQHVSKTKGDLRRHMLRHKAKSEVETCKCYECPYEAKLKADIAKHIRLIHMENKDKYHICKKCYYKTKHEGNLKQHIQKVHKSIN